MKKISEFLLEAQLRVIKPEEITSKSFAKKAFAASKTKLELMNTSPSNRVAIPMNKVDEVVMTKKGVIAVKDWLKTYISHRLNMGEDIAKQSVDHLKDQDILDFWNNIRELMKFRKVDRIEE
jgi:hypothetical protein